MRRIRAFLLKQEIRLSQISHKDLPGIAVDMRQVDLGWTDKHAFMREYFFLFKSLKPCHSNE
jgi:hypothetical protein